MRLIRTSLQPRRAADFSQPDQGRTQRDTRILKTSVQTHPTTHNLLLLWLIWPYKHQVCDSPPGPPSSTLSFQVDISPSSLGSQDCQHWSWQGPLAKPDREAPASSSHMDADLLWASGARASRQHPRIKQGVRVSLSGDGGDKGGPSGEPKENTRLALNASYCYFICQWKENLSGH